MAAVERAYELRADADPCGEHGAPLAAVLTGLRERPKRISPVWFYDERGSSLFDEICELPEYYVTRTELAIMREHLPEIAALLGSELCVIEPGSGTSAKTRMLLGALERPAAYVPVDIACDHLSAAAERLRREHPHLTVHPICADFTRPFAVPEGSPYDERLIYFPGSTIGNFDRRESVQLLSHLRRIARGGAMLIGVDMAKDPRVLVAAYDDSAGVTAAFNLNALEHLNQRLGTDFDPSSFHHRAVWNAAESRIEMHLVSRCRQLVRVGNAFVSFAEGEPLVSEYSHKYTPQAFAAQARAAGWRVEQAWTDPRGWFSVQLLLPAHASITWGAVRDQCAPPRRETEPLDTA
jgi:L-histidine N-alpha-methyltransferase